MKHQIEFRHFRYFLAVAEELHFRRAAEKLFISQPGLSRQIKNLEDLLEVTLFERHNRKVILTPSGVFLQQELNIQFKQLAVILERTKLFDKGKEGSLKIGYVGSAMQNVIPEMLKNFEKDMKNIQIQLQELDNQKQVEFLLNKEIDVGFIRQERVPKNLRTKVLKKETFSLVLPKNHVISSQNFSNLQQLKEESFIMFDASYSQSYYEKVMQIFDDAGFFPKVSHATINASSIYRLVENGFGISIVPTSLVDGYNMDIKFIELTKIKQRTALKMVWNNQNMNPILQNFIQ